MTHPLFALALACAPSADDTSGAHAGEVAGPAAPMLPVTYTGTAGSVAIQVVRPGPSGADQTVGFAEVVDGEAVVRLRDRPTFALLPRVAYRVAAREVSESGAVGQYLGISSDLVWYVRDGSMTEGWYVQHGGEGDMVPLRGGADVVDTLAYVGSMIVSGSVGEDVSEQRAALAMVTDGDATLPMYSNELMNIDGDSFSVVLGGPPPESALTGDDGPTSGHFYPAAWTDNDGAAGFDPAGDSLIGFACANAGPVSVVWSPPPMRVREAIAMVEDELRAGWTLHLEVDGAGQLAATETLVLSSSCM